MVRERISALCAVTSLLWKRPKHVRCVPSRNAVLWLCVRDVVMSFLRSRKRTFNFLFLNPLYYDPSSFDDGFYDFLHGVFS